MDKRFWSVKLWKVRFFVALYIIAIMLAVHDCIVIITHSVNPKCLADASPYILDKFLAALLAMFAL